MGLTDEEMLRIREALLESVRPVILFDDDPDGLSSFLMFYKKATDAKGIPVKNAPTAGADLARKVMGYAPDIVFILDLPIVSQELLDALNTRVIWLDHHPLVERKKVEYYNPRKHDDADNRPTSYWAYRITQDNLWIGMAGMVGDWFMPEAEIRDKYIQEYPDMLSADMLKPEEALHNSRLGTFIRAMSFNLKGKGTEVMKSVKVFTRIRDHDEILNEETPQGRFIYRKFARLDSEYKELMKDVRVEDGKLLLFVYKNEGSVSFSSEISNELIYRHPDKIVLVAWEYDGEYKCSFRSISLNLPELLEKSLEGVRGYGGGHDHAAGACVKVEDWDRFLSNVRKNI